MRHGRPHEHGVKGVLGGKVLGVLGLAGQEPGVLDALDGVAQDRAAPHLAGRVVPVLRRFLVLQLGLVRQLAFAHGRESIPEDR